MQMLAKITKNGLWINTAGSYMYMYYKSLLDSTDNSEEGVTFCDTYFGCLD